MPECPIACHDKDCRATRLWAAARIAALETSILEASGHLGAARIQSIESDDKIIMGHVRDAESILGSALKRRNY